MIAQSWNEWDRLKTVIVGTAKGARVPQKDRSLIALNYANQIKNLSEIKCGPYPDQVIAEAEEDLETLCKTLTSLGVNVLRTPTPETHKKYCNGYWESEGYYGYCPRDSVLIHGNYIIETPMPSRSRYYESHLWHDVFIETQKNHSKWVQAPKPKLLDECFNLETINKNTLTLKEVEPCFDAANVLRCGRDLFYLVSNSGNKLGAKWLQNTLGSEFRVHLLEGIYSYMHLDSTISFLKPGLVLLNPSRINESNLPSILKKWDRIYAPEPIDIGYFGKYNHASPWVGMNLLMVSPELAIVEQNQKELIQLLKSKNIESIPLPIRHARTLGGAFHCVTLDVHREGPLEDYFT